MLSMLALCIGAVPAGAEAVWPELPESSREYSPELARMALTLADGYTAEAQREMAEKAGFRVLLQDNFDKETEDPSHTCAYTAAVREDPDLGKQYLILIRGTEAGEWYSNFDIAPSRNEDTVFAENFLFCAEDVLLEIRELFSEEDDPCIFVCGHSRGAACANILGVLLNACYDPERIYVYTSAAPAVVRRSGLTDVYDGNIFNLINPCDLVPRLPLEGWGYSRFGTDILPEDGRIDTEYAESLDSAADTLCTIAPTVTDYYETRHSMTGPGESENGMTAFELMLEAAGMLVRLTEQSDVSVGNGAAGQISEDSDFAPLSGMLERLEDTGSGLGEKLLEQHLPYTYRELFDMEASF